MTIDVENGDTTLTLHDIRRITLEGQIRHSGLRVYTLLGDSTYIINNRPVQNAEDVKIIEQLIASGRLTVSEYRLT